MKIEDVLRYIVDIDFFVGCLVTLAMSATAMLAGVAIGLACALARESSWRILRYIAITYTWFFRGTPVLLQMVFVFYALPQFGPRFSPFTSAVIALALNEGAYISEIVRAGLRSVSEGQRSAARMLGLSEPQVLIFVVGPQALRVCLPPFGNEFIGMLKLSALASVVAVQDIMFVAQQRASERFDYVGTLVAASVYYLALTMIFSLVQAALEMRLDRMSRKEPRSRNLFGRALDATQSGHAA